jgi:hypothetical protein
MRGQAFASRWSCVAVALPLLCGPSAAFPEQMPAGRDAEARVRRAQALERIRARHGAARFHLEPAGPEAAAAGARAALELAPAPLAAPYDAERLLAGHLLRRISFGPTPAEVTRVLRMGRARYIDWQLNYPGINDGAALARLPRPPRDKYDDPGWQARWYARMVYSRRQLLERMTLIWHEHFATSNEKVGVAYLMHKQEDVLRRFALRNFRDLLVNVTRDQAMLIFLDNDPNNGNAVDDDGNPILPNANYAREFLQLFAIGPVQLNLDGTPILDGNGLPLPNYTEQDVREVARALTGWYVDWHRERFRFALFDPDYHDSRPKTILGVSLPGRSRAAGAREVEDVVDVVMAHPSMPPFISKILIQKLALERPTPGYVQRVATVFRDSRGDLRKTVRAILNDPEFVSPPAVRTQWKEPIEYFVGPARALGARTKGDAFIEWTYFTKQLVYYPPSVFSFYPPGQKRQLVNTATVTYSDRGMDALASGWTDTAFDAELLVRRNRLATPEQVVDYLSDALLVAPLPDEVRAAIVGYMEGRSDATKVRGAMWLITTTPDFQRN